MILGEKMPDKDDQNTKALRNEVETGRKFTGGLAWNRFTAKFQKFTNEHHNLFPDISLWYSDVFLYIQCIPTLLWFYKFKNHNATKLLQDGKIC